MIQDSMISMLLNLDILPHKQNSTSPAPKIRITIKTNEQQKKEMKKKLTLSIPQIINKAGHSGNQHQLLHSQPQTPTMVTSPKMQERRGKQQERRVVSEVVPIIVDQPVRFQELYRRVVMERERDCEGRDCGKDGGRECASVKVIYDSKKVTPVQTCRGKKATVINSNRSAVVNSGRKRKPSTEAVSMNSSVQPQKRSSKYGTSTNQSRNSKQKMKQKLSLNLTPTNTSPFIPTPTNPNPTLSPFQPTLSPLSPLNSPNSNCPPTSAHTHTHAPAQKAPRRRINLQQYISQLNHQQHSHLRERNECFLTEREIDCIMGKIGYDVNGGKYAQFLGLLEVDIYGGTPIENFKNLLMVVEEKSKFMDNNGIVLPKIINNNLELVLDQNKKCAIQKYFEDFAIDAEIVCFDKENYPNLSNLPFKKKTESFQSLLRQKFQSSNHPHQKQQPSYSSPNKKITNSVISDLIEALALSDKKIQEPQRESNPPSKKAIPSPKSQSESMSTFRKIDEPVVETDLDGYNFSRELSGDREGEIIDREPLGQKQDDNIVELKNRLNEALKKSTLGNNSLFSEQQQFNSFLYTNPRKFNNRKPILSVDVNLGEGVSQKIIVFEGESAKQVSQRLAAKYTISPETRNKFQKMLQSHLNTMLWKIDEVSQDMMTDREPE